MGRVCRYARNQWDALNVYVTDGALAMDNNLAERAVKPFAIGRKNWIFLGSDDGGRRLAVLSSFTATCQQVGTNSWTWLQQTLTKLPLTPADQLATLLPTIENSLAQSIPRRILPVRRRTDTVNPHSKKAFHRTATVNLLSKCNKVTGGVTSKSPTPTKAIPVNLPQPTNIRSS